MQHHIQGVLSGLDRVRFRGSLPLLQREAGAVEWLRQMGVAVKDFTKYAQHMTHRFCRQADDLAREAGRKAEHFAGRVDKEAHVQQILAEQRAAENGFVAAFSTLEMTQSFTTFRGRNRDVLRRAPRKCKHDDFYWRDGRFGLTQVRIASWFPFSVHIMINGREWLARQMDERGLGDLRADNCFVQLRDFDAPQKLAFEQPRLPWVGQLNRLLRRVLPLHAEWFCGDVGAVDYYWTAEQTEWATDIVFHDPRFLRSFFPQCVRHGLDTFGSGDVMRFLGHKTPQHGGVNGHYAGQVIGTLTRRSDGLRIKHRIGKNTLKMSLKQPNLIRVETTLNDGRGLKVTLQCVETVGAETVRLAFKKTGSPRGL